MKNKVLIVGDSWGCGEWSSRDEVTGASNFVRISDFITHRGLQQYLMEDGYDVVNQSKPAASCEEIYKSLLSQNLNGYDYIFWIQTDPLRNCKPFNSFSEKFSSYQQVKEIQNEILERVYRQLNDFGVEIYCIGGCSRLNVDILKEFQNLIPLIKSIPELVDSSLICPEISFPVWTVPGRYNWSQYVSQKNFTLEDVEKFLEVFDFWDKINKERKDFFWPDGWHPNRRAHKIVYDYIKNKLTLQPFSFIRKTQYL